MVKSCIFFCKTLPWFVTANNEDEHYIRYSVKTFILLHIFYSYDNSWTSHTYIFFTHIYMYVHWLQVHEIFFTKWCSMFVSRNLKSVMWQAIICTFTSRCIRTIYNKSSFISIKLNCQSIPELNTLGSNMPISQDFYLSEIFKSYHLLENLQTRAWPLCSWNPLLTQLCPRIQKLDSYDQLTPSFSLTRCFLNYFKVSLVNGYEFAEEF